MDFISDEEMAKMEGQAPASSSEGVISDEQMAALEGSKDPGFGEIPKGQEPWMKLGPVEIGRNPLETDWGGAATKSLGEEFFTGDQAHPTQSMSVTDNPLMAMSGAPQAGAGVVAGGLGKVGNFIRSLGQRVPGAKIAPKVLSNGLSSGGGILPAAEVLSQVPKVKAAPSILDRAQKLSKGANDVLDFVPFGNEIQKPLKAADKSISWFVKNAPDKLGKFAPVLRQAAERGGQGVATTDFILSQKSPEYQEQKKKMHGDQ